jgi:hypothetical protein
MIMQLKYTRSFDIAKCLTKKRNDKEARKPGKEERQEKRGNLW